jgi:cytochrome P450
LADAGGFLRRGAEALSADPQGRLRIDREPRTIADLPGPRPLPWVGNLHQMDMARMHRSMEAWSERYGDYFRFRVGRRELLGVADAAAIGAILRDRPAGFRRTRLLEAVFREMGICGVFAANGEAWRAQRRMVMSAFDTRHVKTYFPFIAHVTERFHRRWLDHANRGVAFDLQADLMRYTVDVVAGLAFGEDVNTIENDGETIQTHLNHVFPMLNRRLSAPFPYWRWVRLPVDRALDRHLAIVRASVAELIRKARERLDGDPPRRAAPANLIEAMLVEREAPGTGLTDFDVASNVVTMLLAGEDTTAHTLAWLIHLTSRNPEVARRLTEEADAVLGPLRVAERLELESALKFTAATAHETMRLKPVAPILLLEAEEPKVVGDIAIPRGTVVAMLMRRGSMNERYFERPDAFEPDRWLTADGNGGPFTGRERISMPFGAGPRICPGRNLALLEISLVASMLFRNFEIASLIAQDGGPVEEWLAFTMSPSRLLVTLRSRSAGGRAPAAPAS